MKLTKPLLTLLCLLTLAFSLVACNAVDAEGLWADATYRRDRKLGEGDTIFDVKVTVVDQSVTFTVSTDEDTVGGALLALGLIDGETGTYGLYVKKVNGITADYDIDGSYWGFYVNGEYAMTGVDATPITVGETYELRYEK